MATANQDTTMTSGGASGAGGGGIKRGDSLDTTFTSSPCPVPSFTEDSGTYDRNTSPFDAPRSSGGIPVKFYETVSGTPATLESTLENSNLVK